MNRIVEYLKDPVWWFTAVFIAILASILAGFIKDVISRGLSSVSRSYREGKEKSDAEFRAEVKHLVSDHTLLLLYMSRTLFDVLAAFTLMTIYTVVGATFIAILSHNTPRVTAKWLLGLIAIFAGAAAISAVWKITPRIRLMKASYIEYRRGCQEQKAQSGKGRCLAVPPHTTHHAGPQWAVRRNHRALAG